MSGCEHSTRLPINEGGLKIGAYCSWRGGNSVLGKKSTFLEFSYGGGLDSQILGAAYMCRSKIQVLVTDSPCTGNVITIDDGGAVLHTSLEAGTNWLMIEASLDPGAAAGSLTETVNGSWAQMSGSGVNSAQASDVLLGFENALAWSPVDVRWDVLSSVHEKMMSKTLWFFCVKFLIYFLADGCLISSRF
jgi:hypothetical protein